MAVYRSYGQLPVQINNLQAIDTDAIPQLEDYLIRHFFLIQKYAVGADILNGPLFSRLGQHRVLPGNQVQEMVADVAFRRGTDGNLVQHGDVILI